MRKSSTLPRRGLRGFTLIELMVVMGIIALLAGIVLLAIGHVKNLGDVTAEKAMVSALQKGVEQYKEEFGVLPPLVVDVPTPVDPSYQIAVWKSDQLSGLLPPPAGAPAFYSEYSLPYYIVGALDQPIDGANGLGFTAPNRDGSFSKHGRKHDPLMDPTTQKTRTGQSRLYIENITSTMPLMKTRCVIWDRWSDGGAGTSNPMTLSTSTSHAIRYYRWLPAYYTDPARGQHNPAPSADKIGKIANYNVPAELGDPAKNPELRSAEYAIVSPGPDGAFGTADDIMEVGK